MKLGKSWKGGHGLFRALWVWIYICSDVSSQRERKREREQKSIMIQLKIQKDQLSMDCRVKGRSRKTNKEAIATI